ncbi:MAG: DUF2161 family putative PD-(D/E)XK-type phosphodiesterase [Spirochaeta sp.]|jgi:hypothetical protein|nr:DUF2161 family putative PD-(D/E)XK-type phosphodiesterase [Spirochaeta sp.]
MKEEELFDPIRTWLTGQGYVVSAEVRDCDLVATRPDDPETLTIIEMKTRMSLDLVNQGVRRKEISDSVYLAVPLSGAAGRLRNARRTLATLRRLELGLLYVRVLRTGTRVEPVLHPREFAPRRRPRNRIAILREVDHRYAELDRGGITGNTLRYTAYRQRALRTAVILRDETALRPRDIRRRGGPEECGRILAANHYGWFDRVSRGWYTLSPEGHAALEIHAAAVAEFPSY